MMGAAQSSEVLEESTQSQQDQPESLSSSQEFNTDLDRKSDDLTSSHQGTKEESLDGHTPISHQGTKEESLDGHKPSSHQGTEEESLAGHKPNSHQGTEEESLAGHKPSSHQGTEEESLAGHRLEDDGNSDGNAERETREQRLERKRAEMDAFYNEVVSKREARNKALGDIAKKLRRMEKMEEELEKEREEKQTLELHCKALKEVNKITKEMLRIRETQVSDLKTRLKDVEKKLMESPEEIKVEYEKQMTNYKKLRELYEQRAVAAELEHKTMIEKELAKNALLEAKLKEIQEEIQAQLEKYKENKKQILEMEKNIQCKDDEINNLNESLTSSLAENHILNSQMTLVNNLFSNMLVNPMINLDLLIKLIQDNYLLIIDLVNNHEINDTVSLLVDLEKKIDQEALALHNSKQIKQLENGDAACCSGTAESETLNTEVNEESNAETDGTSESVVLDRSHIQKEIANNLPKVWRILIELLNTHQEQYENNEVNENFDSCYKNVKTNSGKTLQVISVSQTFIRLKHLILEKNHLNNQLVKLKTLNNHLEIRLNQSEQRLNTVTTELKKTWNVVNKLKLQHKQLYTHEKILKYELKHKRNIINDLKIDLEYVREKWDLVKEKNEQNEMDYKVLRKEFALRRLQYDGGRSTSESGISTDTEDDNVEIVETNDESEDDKSEVVETQSEHDVAHTTSVMSIEEDDQDEVEELESEHNVQSTSDLQNSTSEAVIEPIDVIENESMELNHIETNEIESVSLSSQSDDLHSIITEETEIVHSEEEITRPQEPETIPARNQREGSLSQIFLNKKVTIKTIGGQIKVVTELIPSGTDEHEIIQDTVENSTSSMPNFSSKTLSDTFCTEKDNDVMPDQSETAQSSSVPELSSEEQKTKQLTRQERISEDTIEVQVVQQPESSTKFETTNETLGNSSSCPTDRTQCQNNFKEKFQMEAENLQKEISSANRLNNSVSSTTQLAERVSTRTDNPESSNSSTGFVESTLSKNVSKTPVILSETTQKTTPSTINLNEAASTSTMLPEPTKTRTPQEILEARNARLKRLEDQTKNLFHKMTLTSQRSDTLSERLEELHDYYGTSNERHSPRRQRDGSEDSDSRRSASVEQVESQMSDNLSENTSGQQPSIAESTNAMHRSLDTIESATSSDTVNVEFEEARNLFANHEETILIRSEVSSLTTNDGVLSRGTVSDSSTGTPQGINRCGNIHSDS